MWKKHSDKEFRVFFGWEPIRNKLETFCEPDRAGIPFEKITCGEKKKASGTDTF